MTGSSVHARRRTDAIGVPRVMTPARVMGLALVVSLALLCGCTAERVPAPPRDRGVPAGGFRLVAFDSCAEALQQLKTAAKAYVGPWGFGPNGGIRTFDNGEQAGAPAAAKRADAGPGGNAPAPGDMAAGAAAPSYSGTNTHEAGVDEPDLVKTDGKRIVTVHRGKLYVIDPATRQLTGELKLAPGADGFGGAEDSLLLQGDRALVLLRERWAGIAKPAVPQGGGRPAPDGGFAPVPDDIVGPRLVMVDLSGAPKVIGEYRIDGNLVDARQVGMTVRVVVRSAPRLNLPYREQATDEQRTAANREIIDNATADDWLPRYEVTSGGRTSTGRVGCDRVRRPASYSGTSLVTVLSFDLGVATLGAGDPVTVIADGDTVYSNGPRLYVANDQRWRVLPMLTTRNVAPDPKDETTEIYQFDTSGADAPRYVAAASVPGWLINQYAMSEWDGHLRVATTSGRTWGNKPDSTSSVYVLRADGRSLTQVGKVTGLGKGERIHAVRFVGGTGYVVTFRQTDPLYTVDLRDPTAPKVSGELKINGYSAYLHPAGEGRLLGVGQEASDRGRVQGTQLSLFDVSDPTKPTRIAQYHVKQGHSEAEFDPHAFLYWPAERLVVVPLTVYGTGAVSSPGAVNDKKVAGSPGLPTNVAVALRVGDGGFTEVGTVDHTLRTGRPEHLAPIRRSLVVDGVLWTVSDAGLKATSLSTMKTLGWLRTA
ncbi:putative secreted protein with C-terminal beta-propeller domain [Micromonospora kangleipakensis]|uniref:Putative secreted protein with C-terminal beta-propeller domain n=2 Tax=Micromonospora kangleipakensis TaxID=1077942 RepID=A0A4Q8BCE6_9ACTN|nr:putative secreted protein with C-terminal beta-propeller domain [Micromonospora kangleipakensis]